MTRRRQFLQRTRIAQQREAKKRSSFDPSGFIRMAGFGAALTVFLAVWVGFAREETRTVPGPWGVLHRLSQPGLFGISALEIIAVAIAALLALRYWRRMRGR